MNPTEIRRASARTEPPTALAVVVRLGRALLAQRRPDFAELAALVEIDPVLTGSVLRVVRCPLYRVGDPAQPLEKCVEMVGRDGLERILETGPLSCDPTRAEAACRHWVRSLSVAAAARWISNQGAYENPDEAYLAGLVHDVGRLVAGFAADPHDCALRSEAIVASWRLGPRVAAVARWHHALAAGVSVESLVVDGHALDPTAARLSAVVARASELATVFFAEDDAVRTQPPSEDPDMPAVREAIALEIAHAAAVLQLPASDPREVLRTLVEHEVDALRETAASAAIADGGGRTTVRIAELHRHIVDTRGMTAINDMADRGLRAIHERLDFDRVLFLEPDPSEPRCLRCHLVFDRTHADLQRGAAGAEVPLDPGGALARALESELPCEGGDESLDRAALTALGVDTFAVAPLRAGEASLGVVVADRCLSGRHVGEADVAALAMLCTALGLAMENAALDAASKKLRALAEKDELTGIDNRRSILAVLQREVDRARRYGKPLSLALIDVDHFKSWNDLHGHQTGDVVLQSVAQLITSCSREIDSYGRYGGEEFVVVLPETPVDHAVLYAERLRITIEAHGEVLRGRFPDTSLSVSVGIASMSPRGDDVDRMIHRADTALYAAKKHGRNRVCVEVPSPEAPRVAMPSSRGVLDEL